jgi:dolichol-phosphate mannosyltransferase
MDADFSHQPRSIPDFVKAAKGFDVVLGSRYIPGGGTSLAGYRLTLSRGANLLAGELLGLKARDLTTGYRCSHARVLKALPLDSIKTSGYSFLEEILFQCKQKGFSIGETPIFFDFRRGGESKLAKKEILNFFANMLWLKLSALLQPRAL